ncbi:MAG TPA: SGNH/GDSL hydrolase family protein, partial [Candidatus Hydrogenedentes bacterium]|nr:SGNH/GDSL hydrolase family protein [Candidatus Hydrogenedentota bacterium]
LFLGTSQTYGDGARVPAESFVPVLERRLNGPQGAGCAVECLNAAIGGLNSTQLSALYTDVLLDFHPDLTVVNLGCNDTYHEVPSKVFEAGLRRIVKVNEEAGVATLFVLEASSTEVNPNGFPRTYGVMRHVAQEMGVPLLDAHACMQTHLHEGFLFWDEVHLTSFGHGLLPAVCSPRSCDCCKNTPMRAPRRRRGTRSP